MCTCLQFPVLAHALHAHAHTCAHLQPVHLGRKCIHICAWLAHLHADALKLLHHILQHPTKEQG